MVPTLQRKNYISISPLFCNNWVNSLFDGQWFVPFLQNKGDFKNILLIFCMKIMTVCSKSRIKHFNRFCGQNVEILNVAVGGTYMESYHWILDE